MKPLIAWLLVVVPAPALAAKHSVCLLELSDSTSQMPLGQAIKAFEGAASHSFTVISNRKVALVASGLRLPRTQWLTAASVVLLSKRLRCDVPLSGRFSTGLGAHILTLTAYHPAGHERGEVHSAVGKTRVSVEQAGELVSALLTLLEGSPAPATEPTDQPALVAPPQAAAPESSSPDNDVWAAATSGFDDAAKPSGDASVGSEGTPQGVVASVSESLRLQTALEFGGRVVFQHFGFFETPDTTHLGGRDNVEAALRVKAVHPRATAYASVLARADFVDSSRNRFDPEEAWVELTFPSVSVKVGRLLESWGATTLYNPTDVLNPVDLRDPLSPEKVGTLMAKVSASVGPVTLEAYYLPVPETHRLPTLTGIEPNGTLASNSRWLRGSIDVPGSVPVTFHVSPFVPPTPGLSNSQFAVRGELSVGGADLGLGYATVMDHLPSPRLEAVAEPGLPLGANVYVDWSYKRLHVIALDAERAFGKFRVAAEAAAFLTADGRATNPRIADPYFIVNGGFDYQTSQFFDDQRLHFFVEFSAARALRGALNTDGVDLLRTPFPLSVLGRVSWEIGPDLRVEVNAITSVERLDVLIAPRVEYSFFDRVKARIGVDLLAGDSAGYFGRFSNNSRFIATMEARF